MQGGDLTGDGALTMDDVPVFVDVLLGLDPAHEAAADMDCDGVADGRDIQPFVELLVGG